MGKTRERLINLEMSMRKKKREAYVKKKVTPFLWDIIIGPLQPRHQNDQQRKTLKPTILSDKRA